MRNLGVLCKCFLLTFVFSLLVSVSFFIDSSAEEQSQDPEYYKYLERTEAYNKQESKLTSSAIAMYADTPADETVPVVQGKRVVRNGIDISQWNGTINWKKVKAAGIEFVMVRVAYRQYGDGIMVVDPNAVGNLRAAKAAGLDVGVYIYSQAITEAEAIAEADKAISVVAENGITLDLPVVMDYEYDPNMNGRLYNKHLSISAATKICKAFITRAREKGYEPMVYANRSMFTSQVDSRQLEDVSRIWLAEWGTLTPKYTGAYDMWQYTETGSVNGINGYVDMNYQYIPRMERGATADTGNNVPANTDVFSNSTVTYIPVKAEKGKVIAKYVNVRKGPGTKYYKLGTAYKNHEFTVNGKYTDNNGVLWYRVKITLDGVSKTAYISSDYVCLNSEIPKAPVLKQTTQTQTSIKLRWSKVSGAEAYKIFRYNTKKKLYDCIATVGSGVTSYSDKGLVSYKKQKYYVRAVKYKYVNEITSVKSNYRIGYTGGLKGYVNKSNGLNVYSSSSSKTVRCRLDYNERVNIIATVNGRYKIYYDHDGTTKLGYVTKKYIRTN